MTLSCRAERNLHGYNNELEHGDGLFKGFGDLALIFKVVSMDNHLSICHC